MTNVNSGAHTDSNERVHGVVPDEIMPESQEQNAKRHSNKPQVDSHSTMEPSLAGKSNIEMPREPDVPDGARAVDDSAPSNPPTSQSKSSKFFRGRKKSNKEGNRARVCCLRLNMYITMLCGFTK